MSGELVLVTGGSGFVASHCIVQLLRAGYSVRATVRSLNREAEVRAMMREGGVDDLTDRLSFAVADLSHDAGWSEAAAHCTFVLHVASPFELATPKDPDEMIRPARDGALRVLRAARDAGVRRVVMTSSFAAIGYGHPRQAAPFDEKDWTNLEDPSLTPYVRSKTIAERAAWDFIKSEGGALELSVINPVGIFGPALGSDYAGSVVIVKRMLDRDMPAVPRISFGVVDVRDVASLHLLAMTLPEAKGQRFLAVSGEPVSLLQAGNILRKHLGDRAKNVPARELPDWLVRISVIVKPEVKAAVPELGKIKRATSEKAKRLLGWLPRSAEEAIITSGESVLRFDKR